MCCPLTERHRSTKLAENGFCPKPDAPELARQVLVNIGSNGELPFPSFVSVHTALLPVPRVIRVKSTDPRFPTHSSQSLTADPALGSRLARRRGIDPQAYI